MSKKLTQINLSPAVAGDGKLPLLLSDTGLPLYTRAMDAIDQLEAGIQRKDRRVIHDAQLSLNGTVKYIQSQLCYEYSPIRARQDNPDLLDVLCFSGNLGRPLQHDFCASCILFNTDNGPSVSDKQRRIQGTAAGHAAA